MPSSTVYNVKIDKHGIVWIATYGGGLCRYDGKNFFTLNQDNGLKTDLIRNIILDEKNNQLYVGSQAALHLITKDSIFDLNSKIDTSNKHKNLGTNS